jgi:hypothetical protein
MGGRWGLRKDRIILKQPIPPQSIRHQRKVYQQILRESTGFGALDFSAETTIELAGTNLLPSHRPFRTMT